MGQLSRGDRHIYYEHFAGNEELPTVLLSHGWGMSGRVWDDVTAKLTDEGFDVVRYDHRNCGESSKDFEDVSVAALADVDQRSIMAGLNVPALVIFGDSDAVVDPAIGVFAANLLPQGRFVGMSGCGHAPFLEAPSDYQSTLLEFLRELA